MKRRLPVSVCFLLLFLAAGCKTVPQTKSLISLNGMIYDTDNRPVANYGILIDGIPECASDIGGRFEIKNIVKGEHIITGRGNGYLDIKEKVVIRDKAQIVYIRVPSVETKLKEAFSLIKQGMYEQAESCIQEILACDSDNHEALFFMCAIKYLEQDTEGYQSFLKKLKKQKEGRNYVTELEKIIAGN